MSCDTNKFKVGDKVKIGDLVDLAGNKIPTNNIVPSELKYPGTVGTIIVISDDYPDYYDNHYAYHYILNCIDGDGFCSLELTLLSRPEYYDEVGYEQI